MFVFTCANLRLDQRHILDSKKHEGPVNFVIRYFLSHKTKFFHLNILDRKSNEQCDHNCEEASPLLYPGFQSVRLYARKPQMIRVLQFLSIDIKTDFKTKVLFQFFL